MNTSPLTAVVNNGHLTDYFEISRGIRQGCPVSALLFLLCAEVLAINIRNSVNNNGIKCDSSNIKITQYADDTCLFLNNTISLEFALELFENFYRYAGLRLNKDKTEIIWLGKNNRSGKIGNIKINNNATKTLGIWISKNTKEIIKTNFEERINKFKLLLQHWKLRNLTLKGRITILKSKAIPLIMYALTFLFVPDTIMKDVEDIIFDFVWPQGKHHVKKLSLINNIKNGGLNMPDIKSMITSARIMTVKRLLTTNNSSKHTAMQCLKTNNINKFFKYKNDGKYVRTTSNFYQQLCEIWFNYYSTEPKTYGEILDETIWNNKFITIDHRPCQNNKWEKCGIIKVHSLMNDTNGFLTKADIEDKYHVKCDTLYLNSLSSAIPTKWKKNHQLTNTKHRHYNKQ